MFEYRIETKEDLIKDSRLKDLGKEGWELVTILQYREFLLYYFKRAVWKPNSAFETAAP